MSFGLYLHYPFCRNRCAYCDFYKEIYDPDRETGFFAALATETELVAEECDTHARIETIYIGGGTPSLVNTGLLGKWLVQVRELFDISSDLEFSFECNPETVTRELLEELKELGVTRPVFGVQSFDLQLLSLLNRRHCVHDSHQSVYLANALGFETFGADMIFGLPGQSGKMLSADLDQLVDLEPPHISFYQLTVEPGTRLARRIADGSLTLPEEELLCAMYRGGCERLAEAGYVRYEVSSFARPGHECRHNLRYWEGDDYLGLGPSAHSFVKGRRYANVSDLAEYKQTLSKRERPLIVDESGLEQRMTEAIMLGLRTARGIDRVKFSRKFGRALEDCLCDDQYARLIESGHLMRDGDCLRLSDQGFLLADEITRRLLR